MSHMPPSPITETSTAASRTLAAAIKHVMNRTPLYVAPSATVGEAAQQMTAAGVSYALVSADPPGIITDRDLRGRVLAVGRGPQTPVAQIMSRPLKTIDSDRPIYTALLVMVEEGIHHLAVVEEGAIVGLVSDAHLMRQQSHSPIYLQSKVESLAQSELLAEYGAEITDTVEALLLGNLGVSQIGQIVSSLNDMLAKRLLRLAEAELGPPPTPYAWIVFGSEGRLEQALLTDQDNALIYAEESEAARAYFGKLAQKVIDGLIRAGFPPCPGGYMATNWRHPLAEWEAIFAAWVRKPEPQALLEASIFFDFRPVHGELSLEPLEMILVSAQHEPLFRRLMLQNALEFHPPLNFFKRVRCDGDGMVDIKKGGVAPIVGLARATSLAAGSLERSTLERLAISAESGTISQEGADRLAETLEFLLRLRLRQQLAAARAGQTPSNKVAWDELSALERRNLRAAFVTIEQMQNGISSAFR
ncbi:MAG: CBS domain-containing protein [Caldilineaceae bacterium]|nr:CBS domain-containing protein [Caldilineaceae bacterium]MCB0094281.1 CBS domain-containing protein [Caldilineaceae bacterium]MCB0139392.1 CBS domain-containing protein [Caldilineaceae bacterium]MCB9157710.1 CBS domain-containing protein [Caldilineaceae bacterium]